MSLTDDFINRLGVIAGLASAAALIFLNLPLWGRVTLAGAWLVIILVVPYIRLLRDPNFLHPISAAHAYMEWQENTLEGRITTLTESLQKATSDISQIEGELAQRRDLVERLKRDRAVYERFKDLRQEELEAVSEAMGHELRAQDRRAFRSSLGVNAVFFVAGGLTSLLITVLVR